MCDHEHKIMTMVCITVNTVVGQSESSHSSDKEDETFLYCLYRTVVILVETQTVFHEHIGAYSHAVIKRAISERARCPLN